MRDLTLPAVALLAGCLLLAGATAVTAADNPSAGERIDDNETSDAEAGICVIGTDSPCNGEQWDGDESGGDTENNESERTAERIGNPGGNESAEAGICVIGADSPCNGEQWDGDARTNESTESGTAIGGAESGERDAEAGICVIGADSPCNDDRWEVVTSVVDALLRSVLAA